MAVKKIFILLILCLLSALVGKVYPESEEEWGIFSTRFCTVFYEKEVDLKLVNRNINLNFSDFYNARRFRENPRLSIGEILSEKFDAIFNKIEDILDMYPSKIHITINIYKDRNGLDRVYREIFNEPNKANSFYIYKTNTIYTTETFISEKILAHEMAHCIIDHYFVILPPRKIQEMLAVYADVHLKD